MRNAVFLFMLVFLFSCKKECEINTLKKEIIGTWELEHFSGFPFNQPVLPPGNGNIIVIAEHNHFERKQHDSLVYHGIYSLQKKKDCYERNSDLIFSTSEPQANYQYIEISDGKLLLSTPNCYQDGGTAYYRRLIE